MTEPYYNDGCVTIYHADCREILPVLPGGSFDIAVTSPPYNMGLTPGGNGRGMYRHSTQKAKRFGDGYSEPGDDSLDPSEYAVDQRSVLADLWRCTRSAVFYNHRPRTIHGHFTAPLDGDYGQDLMHRKTIIWDRGTGIDVNLTNFCTRQEWILLFAHDGFRLVNHAASGMGDVWNLGMEHGSPHPAPFPIALPARCIGATGAMSVLDPYMGSGTTCRAAKDAGATSVGIERSERWCEVAAKRCAQEVLDFGPGVPVRTGQNRSGLIT